MGCSALMFSTLVIVFFLHPAFLLCSAAAGSLSEPMLSVLTTLWPWWPLLYPPPYLSQSTTTPCTSVLTMYSAAATPRGGAGSGGGGGGGGEEEEGGGGGDGVQWALGLSLLISG